jgi:hypothetical protein
MTIFHTMERLGVSQLSSPERVREPYAVQIEPISGVRRCIQGYLPVQ